jgi:hypothetical protein
MPQGGFANRGMDGIGISGDAVVLANLQIHSANAAKQANREVKIA